MIDGRNFCIKCRSDYGVSRYHQGIISFDYSSYAEEYYYLYKWYDEGELPSCMDMESDIDDDGDELRRLRIVGVDEI